MFHFDFALGRPVILVFFDRSQLLSLLSETSPARDTLVIDSAAENAPLVALFRDVVEGAVVVLIGAMVGPDDRLTN